jgi:hypothetical protein
MSKTSIFRSIKTGRISGTKDEFGQSCIEPCELHRVYPALRDVTDSDSTAEQAVTGDEPGGDTALIRISLLEQRISDLKTMLDEMVQEDAAGNPRYSIQAGRTRCCKLRRRAKEKPRLRNTTGAVGLTEAWSTGLNRTWN